MGSLIAFMVAKGLSAHWARPVAYLLIVLGLVVLLSLAKCGYDRSVIRDHDAGREATIVKADRKADAAVAVQRRADDARIVQESTQLEKVQTHANSITDSRLARHRCLRLQQTARRERRESPTCS